MKDRFPRNGADNNAPRTRLSDTVYEGIVRMIAMGEIALNGRLPSELDLSKRFEVSRPVVRDALARLRDDGVIVSRQGSGSFVQRQPDRAVLQLTSIASIADVQRCFEFRSSFESTTAALAATKRSKSDMVELEAALEAIERCLQHGEPGTEEDRRFHEQIALATHNEFFISVQKSLASQITTGMNITRQLSLMRTPDRLRAVQDEHVEILDAIRMQDSERTRAAMFVHINNARQRMFEGI